MSFPNEPYFPSYPVLGPAPSYGAASGLTSTGAAPATNGMKRPAEDPLVREAMEKKARLEASMMAQADMLGTSAGYAPQQFQLPLGQPFAQPSASALPQRMFTHGPPRQLQAAPTPPPSTYQPSPGPSRPMTPIQQPQLVPRPPPSQPPQQQLQPQPPVELPAVGSTAEREYRRAVFLWHFRNDYFQPLLPPGRNYFSSHAPPGGVLLHYESKPQPKAIQGTMKSYQVRCARLMLRRSHAP